MPIEFRCDQCGKMLRTGDETGGKQAKCPSCGAVQPIPTPLSSAGPLAGPPGGEAGSPFGAGAPPLAPAPDAEVNPYQSPLAPTTLDYRPGTPPVAGAFQPTPIDAGDILNRTWEIFKSQFWMCTLAGSMVRFCNFIFNLVVSQVATALLAGGGARLDDPAIAIPFQFGLQVPNLLFSTWLEGGLAIYLLKIARGAEPSIADVFTVGPWYFPLLIARVLFALMYLLGAMLCLVPGIILALMFGQYFYLIVDRKLSIGDSYGVSRQLTAGNKLHIFVLHLATIGVWLIGMLACCVGIFPAMSFIFLMWAVTYLAISGQPTVDQWLNQPAAGQQTAAPSPLR
ncbi:MAG TPA: hypothetical protein VJ783_02880 [Pirellulales bacterium]|nr:hypothetical protein [Pirellulales bacterium]